MNALNPHHDARVFYRSEAFPEDVADLVEGAPQVAAPPARSRPMTMLWLLGLLPLVALAVGVTWVF